MGGPSRSRSVFDLKHERYGPVSQIHEKESWYQMSRFKVIGLAIVAVFAFSAVAAAAASAHEFESTALGEATDVGTSNQVFKDEPKAVAVECAKLKSTEKITALKTKAQKAVVHYEECTAFGFPATISEAKFEFKVNTGATEPIEGSVKIENPATSPITIEVPAAGCKVTVAATGNSALKKITYENKAGGKVEVKANVSKIVSKVTGGGGLCGKEGELKEGTYTGNALVSLAGAELKVNNLG